MKTVRSSRHRFYSSSSYSLKIWVFTHVEEPSELSESHSFLLKMLTFLKVSAVAKVPRGNSTASFWVILQGRVSPGLAFLAFI